MDKITLQWKLLTGILILLLAISNAADAQNKSTMEAAGDVIQFIVPAAAYATTFILDDKEGRTQFYKSFILNLGITYSMKLIINKPRPDNNGDYAFPSGHTSRAFQGATFIHKRYGWEYSIPAYAGAVFVALSRVEGESDKHDTADVIGGAAIGILSSYFFTTSYKDVTVTPVAENGFYGLNLGMIW